MNLEEEKNTNDVNNLVYYPQCLALVVIIITPIIDAVIEV